MTHALASFGTGSLSRAQRPLRKRSPVLRLTKTEVASAAAMVLLAAAAAAPMIAMTVRVSKSNASRRCNSRYSCLWQ